MSSFSNAVNLQLNADAFGEKIINIGPILLKLCRPVLGVRFYLSFICVVSVPPD